MNQFDRILVGLDNTEIDKDLIKASSELCTLFGTKNIFFINVIKDFDIPEAVKREFPDLVSKAIAERKRELQEAVDKYFTYEKTNIGVNVLVDQGSVTKTLLKISTDEKIDLFVLGRKNEKKAGVLVTRIARRAFCSLLIIPKGIALNFENILVGTDFSDYSKSTIKKTIDLVRKTDLNPKITIQHVYQVPNGYHYSGKSYKEFAEIMKKNSEQDYNKFMLNFNTEGIDITPAHSLDKEDDKVRIIAIEAKKQEANLLVIGAKGRTSAAALFIGSKAERLVQLNEDIPMLVIRSKDKAAAGLIDYVKEL